MYCCARPDLSWRVQPPARTAIRTFFTSVDVAKNSAEKRWVHRSQWGSIPKNPSQNRRENGRLRDGVGVEVVKLHPVVVQERPHEAARRHPKTPLMKGGEADHVPRWWSWVGLAPGGQPLRLRPVGERMEQTLGNEGLQILRSDGGEGPRVARRNDGRLVSHRRAEAVKAEGTRCAVFCSLCLLSQVAKAKAEGKDRSANGRVKNHCRSLSQVYKGSGKNPPKTSLEPLMNFEFKIKMVFPFLEWLGHAQWTPRESVVPSH
jgi:hypothetical protein